jgi:hypothetical protein
MIAWISANWGAVLLGILTIVVKVPFVEHNTIIEAILTAVLGLGKETLDPDNNSAPPSKATEFRK